MKLDAHDFNRQVGTKKIVVSKATLACTAACNANTHPDCFIVAKLDQPVTKCATAI